MATESVKKLVAGLAALLLAAVAVAAGTPAVAAVTQGIETWLELERLTSDDGGAGDRFGNAVAVSGDSALVGTTRTSDAVVYVFVRGGDLWTRQATLVPDDSQPGDHFGSALALDGDTALVGAMMSDVGDQPDQGAVYVFTRTAGIWSQQARLVDEDGTANQWFGASVALDGDTALISTRMNTAHVFVRDGQAWTEEARIPIEIAPGFTAPVALAGDTALIGDPTAWIDGNAHQGSARVFVRSEGIWTEQADLIALDGAVGDSFGAAVALAGNMALVGAYNADAGPFESAGAAYVFDRSLGQWSQSTRLTPAQGHAHAFFGKAVALLPGVALVGALQTDIDGNTQQGAAYLYTRINNVWGERLRLTASDGAIGDRFGQAVALGGYSALVGAPEAAVDGNAAQGVVYAFQAGFQPTALSADPEPTEDAGSDGNGVLEPDETVAIATWWRNDFTDPVYVKGTVSNYSGPPGGGYTLVDDVADFGFVDPAQSGSCLNTGECYVLELAQPGTRPAQHWDATVDESLDGLEGATHVWSLHVGDSFSDVPRSNNFYRWIETMLHHGVSTGCGDGKYCPAGITTRGQMPVVVLRAFLGAAFTPPPCVAGQESFADVPASHPFCPWVEELVARGVVSGCGGGNYCPGNPVTRAQMAVFLLRTLNGPDYLPPACSGIFDDVPCPSTFADWVEELYAMAVTGGCNLDPFLYCPSGTNIRGQMAVFLSRSFGLELYGP